MANLTISIDDDLLRVARVRAAEQGTSVNAVLRDELVRFAGLRRNAEVVTEFLAIARSRPGSSGPGGRKWTRDELHLQRHGGPTEDVDR
ncbi:MAG: hypothetical protein HY827_04365 [Actinobacteria bacterium]|nr:hypothetical protein [Actinomycetota bacterium]